ncbi:hypothetical protein LSCM1_06157 [Leishmania martiniquensis]|uniref:Uncharacterized protein n=1 Tax=Leishmania martiniquensis TaxID=1580590 RepID=A0A836HLC3_9TRYP|nr:hypothetical protein LSCM1_06157 [Leishmania martiniquensis]
MLSHESSTAALASACVVVALICVFSAALFVVTVWQLCERVNVMHHSAVAATLIPVAYFLGSVLCAAYNGLGATLQTFAKENAHGLPQPVVSVIAAIRPLSEQVGLTDTMWMASLLFSAYGVTKVWRHLIDITRLLKASRRRLLLPEMRELRRQEAAAKAKAQKRH